MHCVYVTPDPSPSGGRIPVPVRGSLGGNDLYWLWDNFKPFSGFPYFIHVSEQEEEAAHTSDSLKPWTLSLFSHP